MISAAVADNRSIDGPEIRPSASRREQLRPDRYAGAHLIPSNKGACRTTRPPVFTNQALLHPLAQWAAAPCRVRTTTARSTAPWIRSMPPTPRTSRLPAGNPESITTAAAMAVPRLLWGWPEVLESTGIPRRSLERERAAGRFPSPVKMVGRRPFWLPASIVAWAAGTSRTSS
jgi:predicted DNA-binding transcriptional regulator AlpA